MTRAAVRRQIADWFAAPAVPGLNKAFRAAPTLIAGDDWATVQEGNWGAAAYVHLSEQHETRLTLGGAHGGLKEITYSAALVVLFRWVIPDGDADVDGEVDGWADAYDYLIDNVMARIRQDRTFGSGTGGPIWQAGEGHQDLKLQTDLPKVDDGQVVVWSAVEFEVVEMAAT